ncbi:hypothetical protein LPJ63_002426, partial [Coemansia sp. RSA 2711]
MEKKTSPASLASSGHSRRGSSMSAKSERTQTSAVGTGGDPIDPIDKLEEPDLLDEHNTKADKADDDLKPVPVLKLFRFATKLDVFLNLAGTFFSCASGVVTPVMIIVFSSLMGVIIEFQSRV